MIVYNCYMSTFISIRILKCGGVLAFILLTVYTHTLKYLYNAVHVHVHIFYIFAKRTDTVRTVSSGKTETDQSNVHAHVYVIINTTLGTVI